MKIEKPTWEHAAERIDLPVWRCRHCGKAWPTTLANAESLARRCCSREGPCETPGCTERHHRTWHSHPRLCSGCQSKADLERWQKSLAGHGVDWDGETILCQRDGDRFFRDIDEIQEWFDDLDEGTRVEDVRLVLCEQRKPRPFNLSEWLSDYLPDDDGQDFGEIDRIVNEYIAGNVSLAWFPTNIPVRPESLGLQERGRE